MDNAIIRRKQGSSGGAGVGSLIGSVLGGVVGSIIPGPGTIAGAALGGGLGGAVGGIAKPAQAASVSGGQGTGYNPFMARRGDPVGDVAKVSSAGLGLASTADKFGAFKGAESPAPAPYNPPSSHVDTLNDSIDALSGMPPEFQQKYGPILMNARQLSMRRGGY